MTSAETERPKISALLLAVLLFVGVVLVGVLVAFQPPLKTVWWNVAVIVVILVILLAFAIEYRSHLGWETWRGAITLSGGFGVTVSVLMQFRRVTTSSDWLWAVFLVIICGVAISLFLIAGEWTRKSLIASFVVLLIIVSALILRVGYHEAKIAVLGDVIDRAVATKSTLDATADVARKQALQDQDTARNKTLKEFTEAFAGAGLDPEIIAAANQLLEQVGASTPNPILLRGDLANLLAIPVAGPVIPGDEQQSSALILRDRAQAVVEAYTATPPVLPSTDELTSAINAACAVATTKGPRDGCPAASSASQEQTVRSAVAVPEIRHRLDSALASYRAAVDPTDANKAIAESVAASVPEDFAISLESAFASGPAAIVASIDPQDPLRLVPGTVGWVLLVLLALIGLHGLLRRNARQLTGPVVINYETDKPGAPDLRIAVLLNVPTPSSAPGANLTQSVTDLVSIIGPAADRLGKLVTAIGNIFARQRGYAIDIDLASPSTTPGNDKTATAGGATGLDDSKATKAGAKVLVKVSDAASGDAVATTSFDEPETTDAMRSAGLWAAAVILARSSRIPSWASWTRDTAQALATATLPNPSLTDLENAVQGAPQSGVLLQLYGGQLELASRQVDAVAVYARAAANHPGYLMARYRLAVSVGMLGRSAGMAAVLAPGGWAVAARSYEISVRGHVPREEADDDEQWSKTSAAERAALLHQLSMASKRIGCEPIPAGINDDALPSEFSKLAQRLLTTLIEDAKWGHLAAAALRRSDRDELWGFLHPITGWQSRGRLLRYLARTAQVAYIDPGPDKDERVKVAKKWAADQRSWWQLSYNVACVLAKDNPSLAVEYLEQCLTRPGVNQLRADWVLTDPDLSLLRTLPRVLALCQHLKKEEKAHG